ncbi:MAG: TonB-dependent receptor [Mediterranea sp.]|jgi:hypothetical protein|nr:TonB-dependent receptor [Mediterranea sp.]
MELKLMDKPGLLGGAMMLLATWPAVSLQAQSHAKDTTMNRTVVVEQQYNPNITDAQKVNVLPEIKELTSTPNEVEYDRNIAPAAVLPGTAMDVYTGEEKQDPAEQGYLRLGYGNIGNLDVEGNYLFNPTAKDKLNVLLGMQGWDGKVYYPSSGKEWDSRFYRTKAGIDYVHQFGTADFNVGGNFGLSNFNFMPDLPLDRQRFTSGDIRFGVKSTGRSLPMRFDLETGLYLYSRGYNVYAPDHDGPSNETRVRTKGDFTGDIADGRQIGVAFEMNNLFYNKDDFEDYATLLLRPYYALSEEDVWKLHLGVNVDLAFGYGKKLQVSPDVKAEYIFSESYVLYAGATGGRILNDYRRAEQLNPYGGFISQNADSYERLNVLLGFKMSPAAGFWLNIYGGYQQMDDDLFEKIQNVNVDGKPDALIVCFGQEKTNNSYTGLQINYDYKDLFSFMAKGEYHDWSSGEPLALVYKPKLRLDVQAGVRPVPELGINLGYEFIKREVGAWEGVDDISNLNLSATYGLFKHVFIYARFSNLLNKRSGYYALAPVPGINYVGGIVFSF